MNEPIGFDKDGNEITIMDVLKLPSPDFIDDIHLYIWNMCCDVIGYSKVVDKKDANPNEDKLISLNKAVKFLEDKLICAEGTYASIEFLADIEYNSIREFIEDFKQKMED